MILPDRTFDYYNFHIALTWEQEECWFILCVDTRDEVSFTSTRTHRGHFEAYVSHLIIYDFLQFIRPTWMRWPICFLERTLISTHVVHGVIIYIIILYYAWCTCWPQCKSIIKARYHPDKASCLDIICCDRERKDLESLTRLGNIYRDCSRRIRAAVWDCSFGNFWWRRSDFVRVVNMYRILLPPSNLGLEIEWTLVVTQQS